MVNPDTLEFIDFEKVNTLLEGFNQSTGFVTAILDIEGNILSKSGWRRICTEFHRIHPETAKKCRISDTVLANKMRQGEKYHFYECLNGLIDVAVPIVIQGEHVANLFSGQFFFKKPDIAYFKKQADRYGFEQRAYLEAIQKVPVVSQEKVKTAINFLLNMTTMISEITFQKLELTKLIEKKKANEKALRQSEQDLKESQRIAHVGSWRFDLATGQITWSDELCTIFGFDSAHPPPTTYKDYHHLFTPESWAGLSTAIETSRTTRTPYELELETVRRDGSPGWIWMHGENIRDAGDNTMGIRGVVQDITLRKQVEQEQEKLKAQLLHAQKMESVGRLAGGVAHDFNNMLSIILGNTEIIIEDIEPTSPHLENLEEIHKAAERSSNLTNQLLAFARKQIVAPRVLNLNTVFNDMLKMLKRLIGEDIDLNWRPADNLESVKIDPSQIDQILANLCVNARDAIKDVGKITIETGNITFDEDYCREHSGFKPGNYVMIAVTDNGAGIEQEVLANIFEPFFTTKNMDKGSGLGLATVFGIVKQNNGFINVYSEPGRGTAFRIYLPQYKEPHSLDKKHRVQAQVASGTETILVVEDEPAILRMTRRMLERLGYKVLAASTPGNAIEIAEASRSEIDMVITDVVMPKMNGRDLAELLTTRFPNMKCLFMSGYTANVIAHHGVLDDGVQFINKPFSKNDLARKLRGILDTPHPDASE